MKNSLNLVLAILFFVVLGCACPNMEEIAKQIDESSKNANSTSNSNSATPSNNNSSNNNSSNTSSSSKSNLTLEKYNQIKNGMSHQEVVEILGSEGIEQSSSGDGKYKVDSYKWEGDNYKFITVIFMGDKVNSKVQYGLK